MTQPADFPCAEIFARDIAENRAVVAEVVAALREHPDCPHARAALAPEAEAILAAVTRRADPTPAGERR